MNTVRTHCSKFRSEFGVQSRSVQWRHARPCEVITSHSSTSSFIAVQPRPWRIGPTTLRGAAGSVCVARLMRVMFFGSMCCNRCAVGTSVGWRSGLFSHVRWRTASLKDQPCLARVRAPAPPAPRVPLYFTAPAPAAAPRPARRSRPAPPPHPHPFPRAGKKKGKKSKAKKPNRDWARGAGMRILNSKEPTRVHQESRTSPDVTVVPAERFQRARWTVLPCAGSDHSPILTELPLGTDPVRTPGPGRVRWAWDRADWKAFQARTEGLLGAQPGSGAEASAHHLNDRFTKAVMRAAKEAIPTAGGRRRTQPSKPWWSKEIAELVALRQEARKKAARTGAREDISRWNYLCRTSSEAIRTAKREKWGEFVDSLDMRTDPTKIHNAIKTMDGRRPTTRSMGVLVDGEMLRC
eukprot:gene19565-biopygen23184